MLIFLADDPFLITIAALFTSFLYCKTFHLLLYTRLRLINPTRPGATLREVPSRFFDLPTFGELTEVIFVLRDFPTSRSRPPHLARSAFSLRSRFHLEESTSPARASWFSMKEEERRARPCMRGRLKGIQNHVTYKSVSCLLVT